MLNECIKCYAILIYIKYKYLYITYTHICMCKFSLYVIHMCAIKRYQIEHVSLVSFFYIYKHFYRKKLKKVPFMQNFIR